MPVTVGNGTVTPVVGIEQDVATIAPGISLDNVSVYVVGGTGGGNGPLEFALYATVGGFRTRVAQKQLQGSDTPTLIDWDTGFGPLAGGGDGAAQTEQIDAGGTNYTLTVIDRSTNFTTNPRNPVSATIAGVDAFDTAPGADFGQTFALVPGATGTLTLFPGYAQLMDVAVDQANLPPVTVSVTADCGLGSVLGTVVRSVQMTGRDEDIASVFRELKLPVATEYFVSVTNNSRVNISVTLTGVTYSVSATSGGAVVLNGDVIGPSNNNKVIKWDNVPLTLAGLGTFGPPVDAAIPIFNAGLGTWRALVLGQDIIVDDNGFATVGAWLHQALDPVTMGAPVNGDIPQWNAGLALWQAVPASGFVITLTGNVNGPSNANKWTSFIIPANNVDVVIPAPEGWWYVGVSGLTANHTVLLPAAPTAGEVVVVTDEDGSLLAHSINVNGNGKPIQGAGIFAMNSGYPGANGSICFQFDGTGWFIFADFSTVGAPVVLVGNVNGPSNVNRFETLNLQGNDANVTIPENNGWWSVRMRGLTAPRTVTLPVAPDDGEVVVVKDGDGSLGGANPQTIIIDPGPFSIDEVPGVYTMTAVQNGVKGSVSLYFETAAPAGWYLF